MWLAECDPLFYTFPFRLLPEVLRRVYKPL